MCVVRVLQRLKDTLVDFSNQFAILMNLFRQQVSLLCVAVLMTIGCVRQWDKC